MLDTFSNNKYISVSELSNSVKGFVEQSFGTILLKGEISGLKLVSTGHVYFSLKDNNCTINACIWRSNWARIVASVGGNEKVFANGVEVLVECTLGVYAKNTSVSVIISKMEPAGKGEMALKFEMLKQKLAEEGLFEQSRKKSLPEYPKTIGIVSADTAAGKGDMVKILKERSPFLKIVLFPTAVQGDKAAPQIIKAINCATQHYLNNTSLKPDVLIIGRGGGAIEDMWCFNDENLARVIADCPIPTITGIGHEQDFTIADFVADYRASTPTNAAQVATGKTSDIQDLVNTYKIRLGNRMHSRFENEKMRASVCSVDKFKSYIQNMYKTAENNLNFTMQSLQNAKETLLTDRNNKFALLASKLDSLSPLKVMARGYSIAETADNKLITSSEQVSVGDRIQVMLNKGKIDATVINKQ